MAGLDDVKAAQRPADYPISYSRGDSLYLEFQIRDGRSRPVDLTGLTVAAVATAAGGYAVSYDLDATLEDPATGLVSVSWPPSTGALLPSSGVWSLTLSDGSDWQKVLVTGSLAESRTGTKSCGCSA
jgi:hypothetical protein